MRVPAIGGVAAGSSGADEHSTAPERRSACTTDTRINYSSNVGIGLTLTLRDWPASSTLTPLGIGTGFMPMRDSLARTSRPVRLLGAARLPTALRAVCIATPPPRSGRRECCCRSCTANVRRSWVDSVKYAVLISRLHFYMVMCVLVRAAAPSRVQCKCHSR